MKGERALVIGGTGPTGPAIVEGLADRGYEVTVLHAGLHEVDFAAPGIRHIHEDPHFQATLERGLDNDRFDLVVVQYGRLRMIADVLAGRTDRLIAIGGATGIFASTDDLRWGSIGRPALFPEDVGIYETEAGADGSRKIGVRMVEAMDNLFSHHDRGDYSATYVMYPVNYGPRNPGPTDWSIVRRILEGRTTYIIADGGLKLESRVYSENAAQAVLLVVDSPVMAAGKRYSVADPVAYTMRQRIEFIGRHLERELRLVDMPYELGWPCHPFWRRTREHRLCNSNLIRVELGFVEAVAPDEGLIRTIDWLVANRPDPGGEAEQQIGDPFDYASEDEIIRAWEGSSLAERWPEAKLPSAAHQYRHPTAPGEAWKPRPAPTSRVG